MSKKSKSNSRNNKIKSLEGIDDVLPEKSIWWKMIQEAGERTAKLYRFYYIETPLVEKAELFEKTLGKNNKNFFTFKAGTRTKMSLRADISIPVMRSYLEHKLGYFSLPFKSYTYGPVFIKNRKGQKRQFRKFGFQIIGGSKPIYDIQIVMAVINFLNRLKIKNPVLKINVTGCKNCEPLFKQKLKHYYQFHKNEICKNCQKKYKENDIIGLLKCDKEKCLKIMKNAPNILDYLCENCRKYFQDILELMEDNEINYVLDPHLLGDKDYNNRLVFEIYPAEGYGKPIVSGGREDYLSQKIGGPKLDAIEAVVHIDVLMEYLKENNFLVKESKKKNKIFFIAIGGKAKKSSVILMNRFRNKGIIVIESIEKDTLKSQLRIAERSNAGLILIYGQKELFENTVIMREIDSGCQESVPLEKMINEAKVRLRKTKNIK